MRNEEISQKLMVLKEAFQAENDAVQVEKIMGLKQKWDQGEFVLAFCGHFSAGKSTMINTLLGKEILPSSPIPTSANVVKVKSGEAKAVAYFENRDPVTFDYVKDLNRVQEYCRNGDEVVSVDIFYPNDFLVNDAVLLDTPGIDSTDSAHKMATESAIYLADAVVYMMDYNHVQSQVNFRFTKTLKDKGKTLYLVINQIDKHFDLELTFSDFKQGVKDAFHQWGIEPDAIFYTTLKTPTHPENQLEELHDHLYSLFLQKNQIIQRSVIASVLDLIHEHERVLKGRTEQQKKVLMDIIGQGKQAEIETSYAKVHEQVEQIQQRPLQFRKEVNKELQSVIEHANITPFAMRECAKGYLESCEPGFKVGFLFSTKKTKQEKQRRFQLFYEEVEKQVKANLEWHVRDILQNFSSVYSISIPVELQEKIDGFHVRLNPDLLVSQVKHGARVTGDAVLNYCRDLASEIKGLYRQCATAIIEECMKYIAKEAVVEENHLQEKSREIQKKMEAVKELSSIENRESRYIQELKVDWRQVEEEEGGLLSVSRTRWEKPFPTLVQAEKIQSLGSHTKEELVFASNQNFKGKLIKAADSLRKAASLIEDLRGHSLASREMKGRAERLEQNLFTVALFGAFSAGKSSFANAMMGEMVLPVSPNPTTATINQILPPTEEFPHGSVIVKFKNEVEMHREVMDSLQVFRLQANTIEEAVTRVSTVQAEGLLPTAKPHYSFLKAVGVGIQRMKGLFGQEQLVGMEEFRELVSLEEKACFVEWIRLYYACPLTNQGISLIDTPGANSIHVRHTGVAFQYMKNADAVLFVTYYNHAFSHGDREFLQQLGRVKDIFELDKMFFLVNAADLAQSKDELQGVVQHVRENLQVCGVRHPRLYPVSSQTALLARMYGAGLLTESIEGVYRERTRSADQLMAPEDALAFSGFEEFEHDFIQFTIEELTEVAVEAARGEIRRSIHGIRALVDTAKEGEEQRKTRLLNALESKTVDISSISTRTIEREQRQLGQEVEELFYYVKQRLFFRFQELFSYSFNPAVIKEGKGKEILPLCLDDFMRNMELTLQQEFQATSLLVEKTGGKLVSEILREIQGELKADIDLSYPELRWNTPEVTRQLRYEPHTVKRIFNVFKSPKQFFEQGGREAMRERMEKWADPYVSDYLNESMNLVKDHYVIAFENHFIDMKQQWLEQTEGYYDGLVSALEEKVDTGYLEGILDQLEGLL